jgi:nucleotide-binding universal stress UspA family protein
MASSRIGYGMGRDLVLPGWFGRTHAKHKTPANGILFTGSLAILLAMTGQAEVLAEISSSLFMVSYALMSVSLIVLRRVTPRWYRPGFKAPFFPVLPLVSMLLCLSVILTMDTFSQIAGLSLVALSLVWYLVWVRRKAVVTGELAPMWERERPMERLIEAVGPGGRKDSHEVLIPVWDRTDPSPLLELAAAMGVVNEEVLINVMKMEVTPPQIPLEIAQARLPRRTDGPPDGSSEAVARTAEKGVPIRVLSRAVRSPESGVMAYIDTHPSVSLVLTHWEGALSSSRVYGSPTKKILEGAPCDVAVLLPRVSGGVRRILIPVGGGPHARLGLRLAAQFAEGGNAELTALRVVQPHDELDVDVETAGLCRVVEDVLGEDAEIITSRVVVSENVIEAILETAREGEYDLLVIGASEEWQIKSLLAGSLPDAVADRSPCSVLLVRRYEAAGISWTRRILSSLQGWD